MVYEFETHTTRGEKEKPKTARKKAKTKPKRRK